MYVQRDIFLSYSHSDAEIGDQGGPVHLDFQHVTPPIPFLLEDGRHYDLEMVVGDGQLTLSVDGIETYSTALGEDVEGRVGIRPWRSRVESDHFLIEEL